MASPSPAVSPAGAQAPPRIPPLVPGWPRGRRGQAVAGALCAAAALAAAYGILRLQVHYVDKEDAGHVLSRWTQLVADGSGLRTSIGPWAAALLFVLTARRVLSGPPEPPLGPSGSPSATAAEMRHALRRELNGMRWVLLALAVLAALDGARVAVYLVWGSVRHSPVARDQLGWAAVEALGLLVAAVALGVATWAFRGQVRDLGGLAPPPPRPPRGS